jgi:hypothetical protein
MKKLCPHLTNLGITVLDLTKKGWTPTEANILALANEIREIPDTSNIPVIMDLLGNFAFRYEQSDGTQALPFKWGEGTTLTARLSCAATHLSARQ